jgi:hypothetical protein
MIQGGDPDSKHAAPDSFLAEAMWWIHYSG